MRAQMLNRRCGVRVCAFGRTAPKQQHVRGPLRQHSSSSSNAKRGTKDTQQLLQFIQEWAPVLQAEHAKMQQAADRLANIEQVLASEDDPTPVLQGPGLKLTAANTCSRWLPAHASASSSSPDSWSLPVSAQSSAALHYNSAGQHSSSVQQDDSTAAVHQMLQDIRSTEQEVSALLGSCMQEMNSMLCGKPLLKKAANSSKHSSNIVPWAPTAAAAAAAAAAAPAVPSAVLPAAVNAAGDVPPLPAAAAAAAAAAAMVRQVPAEPAEQLVVVYLNNSSSSSSSSKSLADTSAAAAAAAEQESPAVVGEVLPPCVCYLRLPQQRQEYEAAVQQGLRVVPLKGVTLNNCRSSGDVSSSSGSSSSSSGGGGLSIEELAWMNQQQGCWGHEEAPLEFFSGLEPAIEPSMELEESAPAPETPAPAVVKVEVGVKLQTKPGQRVLLVGNHPTLGSWDLSKAWKLKWSDGHIWRGCLELPADIPKIEFKAVLKSADAAIWERGSNKQVQLQGTDTVAMQYAFQA